ncbi:MAG: hypothetical protein IT239_04670 [Bacteroidia bacterium]|nr:hypothetical protein [Bacteroidia bacterium]
MLKDIPELKAENMALAAVLELNELQQEEWNVYLLNTNDKEIDGVLVSSTGYGLVNDEKRKTTTLRHFLDTMQAHSFKKIEAIVEEVFGLNNEYWVSYYIDKKMHERKFIFLPETIKKEYLTNVPLLNKKGILIQ